MLLLWKDFGVSAAPEAKLDYVPESFYAIYSRPDLLYLSFDVGTTVVGDTDSSGVVANRPPSALMRQTRKGGFLAHRSLLRSEDETEILAEKEPAI